MNPVVLIPAYKPDHRLLETLRGLAECGLTLLVVNDGSPEEYRPIFREAAGIPSVTLIEHAVNLGKGAALRTCAASVTRSVS
jgi:glycosyltransferase involved in cell wall biosynthesis